MKRIDLVVGTYQSDTSHPTHAIINDTNRPQYGPLKTMCGSVTGLYDSSPCVEPMNPDSLPVITCKKCLQKLKLGNDQLNRPKVIDHLARTVELAGTHTHYDHHSGATHAMVSGNDATRAICGTIFPDNTYPYIPWPSDTKARHKMVSNITCLRCLKVLASSGIEPDPKDELILRGFYSYEDDPVHALVKREPERPDGSAPLRYMCNPDIYCLDQNQTPAGNKAIAAKVTCVGCLRNLREAGILASEKPSLDKTQALKKFFLVFYDGDTVSNICNLEELIQDVQRFEPNINKILLIDSYREISVEKSVIVADENGNKITKEDL